MANTEPALKTRDVAEIIGVHPKTVLRYFATGLIRARKTSGTRGDWITTRKDLDDYLGQSYEPRTGQ